MTPDIMTTREAMKYLKIGKNALHRFFQTGEIRALLVCGKWLTRPEWLMEFLERKAK
jgi:excisionase family DNA binding protein